MGPETVVRVRSSAVYSQIQKRVQRLNGIPPFDFDFAKGNLYTNSFFLTKNLEFFGIRIFFSSLPEILVRTAGEVFKVRNKFINEEFRSWYHRQLDTKRL